VSDTETTSVAELIELIGKALGRRPRNVPVPPVLLRAGLGLAGRGRDIGRLFAPLEIDSSRIRTELDWSPPISLAEGVRRAVSGA
jgi:nucleoside-diphosphate-sugar epimerase